MAKTLMPRRKTERDPKPKTSAVAELIASRAAMIQTLDYEPLGRLIQMQISTGDDAKWIEFRRRNKGPSIGRLSDGSIDLVDPWPGLDDRLEATLDLCPDCLAPCDECGETGRRLCTQCGGAKEVKAGEEPCDCVKEKGQFDAACTKCRGGGSLPVMEPCDRCEVDGVSTGKMQCPECLGGGKMSTGHLNGALPTRRGPVCPSCEGYGRALKRTAQELNAREFAGAYWLGPIMGFMVKPIGEQREPETWIASADAQGNYLYLASAGKFVAGTRVAFIGGIVVPQPGMRQ